MFANVRSLTIGKLTQTEATTGTSGVTSRTGSNTTNWENSTGQEEEQIVQIVPGCTAEVLHFQGISQKSLHFQNEMVGVDTNPTNRCTELATLRRLCANTQKSQVVKMRVMPQAICM